MLECWAKEDQAMMNKLPVEADVPELILKWCLMVGATSLMWATGDWVLIAYDWLLRNGEYTGKASQIETKQTVQFKLEDCAFFKEKEEGKIVKLPLPWSESDEQIMAAESTALKLNIQKMGGKGYVCTMMQMGTNIYAQYVNWGDAIVSSDATALRIEKLQCQHTMTVNGVEQNLTDGNIRSALKKASQDLNYPKDLGMPVEWVDTHSLPLPIGGANAMSLAGYTDRQIQKMGRWRGATFKENIREELHSFSKGMPKSMKKLFVNVAGGA